MVNKKDRTVPASVVKSNGVSKTKDLRVVKEVPPAVEVTKIVDLNDENISMTADEITSLRGQEQNILQLKLRLSDLEVHLSDLNNQKSELIAAIKNQSADMLTNVRAIAQAHGIDPDGTTSTDKWNLDTSRMIFERVK